VPYDAVIIGGGPAGSAAALTLADAGWRVAVVERTPFPRRKVCGEYLSATNWPLFRRLGIWESFVRMAGPDISRVALFAQGSTTATAPLPSTNGAEATWGRALTRDRLDSLLITSAAERGALVMQPIRCTQVSRSSRGWSCATIDERTKGPGEVLEAPVLIAAHGSWSPATAPIASQKVPPRPMDLFGFKAHFSGATLPEELMPLLAFRGGYGGMVTCQDGLVSLSCCVRRDVLEQIHVTTSAGDNVLDYLRRAIPAVADTLSTATRSGNWLSAGPIRPGRRHAFDGEVFAIGNLAGEAHPVVAEGISMAIQSGFLAADCLLRVGSGKPITGESEIAAAGQLYAKLWKRAFLLRIRVSHMIAAWATRPTFVHFTEHIVRRCPWILTNAARIAGKSRQVRLRNP